ncbi:hypothetical protein KGY73_05385 [bacterium]|nr:hypothetical protein [bacterium]
MAYPLTVAPGPAANSFYIDNIQVPNINHYPRLGSTTGSLGLLNVDFIRDVHFHSGDFSPSYGNTLSSVMDIRFREGNLDEPEFQLGLDMMGASAVGEGPLPKDTGSWMLSEEPDRVELWGILPCFGLEYEF